MAARFGGVIVALQERLNDAIERGEVRNGVAPERLVDFIGGATLLAVLQSPNDLTEKAWVDDVTEILMHGIAVR